MKLNVAIVGAGNVAWHMGPALDNVGATVRYVYNRNARQGEALVRRLYEANLKDDLNFRGEEIDLIILSVADDAIEEVAGQMEVDTDTIVVHTSGAQSIDVLDYYFANYGVLYPLQTFSRSKKIDFQHIPLFVEGENKRTTTTLLQLAKRISKEAREISSRDRLYVHLAAVFASNFSNHMLAIAEEILGRHTLDLKVLYPLISETINKALEIGPSSAQTGPARRHDLKTLDKHMSLLAEEEDVAQIYRLVSQHILDSYSQE